MHLPLLYISSYLGPNNTSWSWRTGLSLETLKKEKRESMKPYLYKLQQHWRHKSYLFKPMCSNYCDIIYDDEQGFTICLGLTFP